MGKRKEDILKDRAWREEEETPRGPGTMEPLVVFEEVDIWKATLIGRASHPTTPQIAKEKMTRP